VSGCAQCGYFLSDCKCSDTADKQARGCLLTLDEIAEKILLPAFQKLHEAIEAKLMEFPDEQRVAKRQEWARESYARAMAMARTPVGKIHEWRNYL